MRKLVRNLNLNDTQIFLNNKRTAFMQFFYYLDYTEVKKYLLINFFCIVSAIAITSAVLKAL